MLFTFTIKTIKMGEHKIEHLMSVGFRIVLTIISLVLIAIGIKAMVADHAVRYYYVSGRMDNEVKIKADIDWGQDEYFVLDRAVSYEEATELARELNKSLPK
jgi:uncharacterized membrane protein YidH (DUF202 family)